ncbi:MAG: oligosaccharide flippase family protein [Bacteroidota bacterium]
MKFLQLFWKSQLSTRITLLDQLIVSGCNFLLGILLTRWLGLDDYGVFALAWMGLLLASNLQLNFILKPMMSLGPKEADHEAKRQYYASVHYLNFGFLALIALIGLGLVYGADEWFPDWGIGYLFPVLPLAVLAFLWQEFYRRLFFVSDQVFKALILDALAYGGMIIGTLGLYLSDQLSVASAYGAVMGSFCVSFVLGLWWCRHLPRVGMAASRNVFQRHWRFSSWLVGTALLQFFGSNFFLVAAGSIVGSAGVGALRIAQNLMGLTHILFQAMENTVPIKASGALIRDGINGMLQYLKLVSLKTGLIIGLILLSVALAAEPLISLVYGAEFTSQSYLLIGYCVFYATLFPGYPLRYALRSLEFTQPIFVAYIVSTAFSLLAAYPMVERWGLMGVVYGLIITQILMQACYAWMLRQRVRRSR